MVQLTKYFAQECAAPLSGAFSRRQPLLPWRARQAVDAARAAQLWHQQMNHPCQQRAHLLYIHVPFCANHCRFCGFYKHRYTPAKAHAYVESLNHQLMQDIDCPRRECAPLRAVYLGGGTPSALTAEQLETLLSTLRTCAPLADDCEITLEGRSLHFDDEKLIAAAAAGVNRISIGVQSFDTRVRQLQGRRSSREQIKAFIKKMRTLVDVTIVIDLIFGLPEQDMSIWQRDIEDCIDLAPDGVDLYALNVFPSTPLHAAIERGKINAPTTLSDQGQMYQWALERLLLAGWTQLSNSHFARNTRERNLYNLLIKQGADTFAYGAGAGGSLGPYSAQLEGDAQEYARRVELGELPLKSVSVAGPWQPLFDTLTGQLETGGLQLDLVLERFPELAAQLKQLDPLLDQWQRAGLLRRTSTQIELEIAGRFWSNNLVVALQSFFSEAIADDSTR